MNDEIQPPRKGWSGIQQLHPQNMESAFQALGPTFEAAAKREPKGRVYSSIGVLEIGARIASKSFARGLSADELADAVTTGVVAAGLRPFVRQFLDEAPLSVLATVVLRLSEDSSLPASTLWKNMRTMAQELRCLRCLWA